MANIPSLSMSLLLLIALAALSPLTAGRSATYKRRLAAFASSLQMDESPGSRLQRESAAAWTPSTNLPSFLQQSVPADSSSDVADASPGQSNGATSRTDPGLAVPADSASKAASSSSSSSTSPSTESTQSNGSVKNDPSPYQQPGSQQPNQHPPPPQQQQQQQQWQPEPFGQVLPSQGDLASLPDCTRQLAPFPKLNRSDEAVRRFACMAETYLRPWVGMPLGGSGGKSGGGGEAEEEPRGIISHAMLQHVASEPGFMSCSGHIRIIDGKVFFRYGGFHYQWDRLHRFVQSVKLIQAALHQYGLHRLRAEFFLSTCDLPKSFDSSLSGMFGGRPIFSTEWLPGTLDIIVPDPLDLSEDYQAGKDAKTPWESKASKAVFRGGFTNFKLGPDHRWRVSPRYRLHRMTDLRPDLLDARVMRLLVDDKTRNMAMNDGLSEAPKMGKAESQRFKYEVVVDGGAGSCRTCGVLGSDQAMIRQDTPFAQFYQPLLHPWRHFIPTDHFFGDLFDRVEWARKHDKQVQHIIANAHRVARWGCSLEGRTLYWAILLVKYSTQALEDPSAVQPPERVSTCPAPPDKARMRPTQDESDRETPDPAWPPVCADKDVARVRQPLCTFFCVKGPMPRNRQIWLSADLFDSVDFVGPHLADME
ncbi:hypothetical protein CLOM_g23692 [Closterium sp. NIES-68]|nr:hypothetical protein CLOM_g23692 [Closterium sp. NIES-68]GJP74155.1 hypothetical protein CLOP_g4784 [Closterium sp. NIES-67]